MNMEMNPQCVLEMYRSTLDFIANNSNQCYWLFDFETEHIYFSKNIQEKYIIFCNGINFCTLDEWSHIIYPHDLSLILDMIQEAKLGRQEEFKIEYRLVSRVGEIDWVSSSCQCYAQQNGEPWFMLGNIVYKSSTKQPHQTSSGFHMEDLKVDISNFLQKDMEGFLLLVDVDDLKAINLNKGRDFGDQVLQSVAESMEDITFGSRRVYRTIGDSFAVTLPDVDARKVQNLFSQLQKRLEGKCTLSGGCVPFQKYIVPDAESMYQYAENTLDHAKAQGKNQLLFFSSEDYKREIDILELKEDLKKSIEADFEGFSLCYQPQVHSNTYRLFGAEALLRYHSPHRGAISPVEFIPILEQTRLICPVGIWVLRTALEQCKKWRKLFPDFHISVNISYTQLCQDSIMQDVVDVVKSSGLPGDALTLEITESIQLQDYLYVNDIFSQWKEYGIEISVDDFGTGYSSLNRLKDLKIDEIKIDRCFVNHIQNSAYNYRLLSNMLELADSFQIRVCCEGVETIEELSTLEELHPLLLQGFLFSKPCTPDEFFTIYFDKNAAPYQKRLEKEKILRKSIHRTLPSDTAEETDEEMLHLISEADSRMIYLSDMDTGELLYLNPVAQRLLGVRDYRGRKCYKTLYGLDEPCSFCSNQKLKKDTFYIWEHWNEYCGRRFLSKEKYIDYHDKQLHLTMAQDITKKEIISQNTQELLNFAHKVVDYAKLLSTSLNCDQGVEHVLSFLGEFYRADRTYLFQQDSKQEDYWNNTCEWCAAQGISSKKDELQHVSSASLAWLLKRLGQDRTVVITNLESIHKESPEQWQWLRNANISKLMAVPLCNNKKLIGFVGVDNPHYAIGNDSQLRVLSSFLLNYLRNERCEARYRSLLQENYDHTLDLLNLGLWTILIDPNSQWRAMLADDTMYRVLGLEERCSAEQCYQFWYSRINQGYFNYVKQSLSNMIQNGHAVQLEYTWKHPVRGDVVVRCTGIRVEDQNGMICLKGYHRTIDDLARPSSLPDLQIKEVFEYNEVNQTIFFHTNRSLLSGEETHEENFPQCWIKKGIVHPNLVYEFQQLFSRIRRKNTLDYLEVLLKSKNDHYSWFKVTLRHLGKEQEDLDTAIVTIEPVAYKRITELEYMRIRNSYHSLLSGAVAYAEYNVTHQHLKDVGGLWSVYAHNVNEHTAMDFLHVIEADYAESLSDHDRWLLHQYGDVETCRDMLAHKQTTNNIYYRQLIQGEMHWVECQIHLFLGNISQDLYLLIYLRDIQMDHDRVETLEHEISDQS